MHKARTNVMVVDDAPSNLQLLVTMLQMEGYKVRPVRSGKEALAMLKTIQPDVILLDICMPEMDGFEVCRRIKSELQTHDVPILFVSALQDTDDKVKAFEAGCTDYITKPFQMAELRMRIETHLAMARIKADLLEANRKLKESEQRHEMLAHLVAHDMRNPLNGISGMAELVSLHPVAAQIPDIRDNAVVIHDSARILSNLISDMLDVYKHECGEALVHPARVMVADVVADSLRMMGAAVRQRLFECRVSARKEFILCDRTMTTRVVANLLGNAFRFTRSGTRVELLVEDEDGFVRFGVRDEGDGITPEDQERLFRKFGRLEGPDKNRSVPYSTGLGLVFCRLVTEAQGGKIGLVSAPGAGSTFWFTIPAA